jgi:hypothetical protein
MKTVAFFMRHFGERGTETAMYDYAHYNETILGNRSIIVCFTEEGQQTFLKNRVRHTLPRFQARFSVYQINTIEDMASLIDEQHIHACMCLQPGPPENYIYKYDNPSIWKTCKTIKLCVFDTRSPEGTIHASISPWLNTKNGSTCPVLPHIVQLPDVEGDLRQELGIPADATVFGGYGGADRFDIQVARQAVEIIARTNPSIYFLFANFHPFCSLPNVRFIPMILDVERKVKFIQSCDAMLWARSDGETFGLSIAEFSLKNKPVFCTVSGDLAHLEFLGDKAIVYQGTSDLCSKLVGFNKGEAQKRDWNAYRSFSPEKVMEIFKLLIA